MKFGLTSPQWETIEKLLLAPLKSNDAQVWVFGSRARGTHRQFSDLDILYATPQAKPLPLGVLGKIREDLEESNLPIKIDIVDEAQLAESYKPGVLKDRILLA